jgi:triacylglycerol lipase
MNTQNDLISFIDDFELAELLQQNDSATKERFKEILGETEVNRLLALETREDTAGAAGLRLPPDPSLPEIVLLHGITDCHLADTTGLDNRIWFQLNELFRGRFTRSLPLQKDGVSDQPGKNIKPDGHLDKKYGKALSAWTKNRFRTQVYCYDWRRSVQAAADKFEQFLQSLDSIKNGEKVILVCHSMGGLVASTYASTHSGWADKIEHCIFAGSPLGGSYSVPMNVLGKSESVQKMDRYSVLESLEDFQSMLASFPGLIDMLPNPALFPDAEDLYSQNGWPGEIKPSQDKLDASRRLKEKLWNSPIFSKATHLISQGHETVAGMPWNADDSDREPTVMSQEGDGAALSKSSLAPNLTAYKVTGSHGMLVNEPNVHEAIMTIARGETPSLPAVSPGDLTGETSSGEIISTAGLSIPSVSTDLEKEKKVGAHLALHYASADAVAAGLAITGVPGFDRSELRRGGFSWKNALSMAIASEDAYHSHKAYMPGRARNEWGFDEYKYFAADDTEGFICWDDQVVVLSFRGTEKKLADWARNLKFGKSHDTGSARYGKVHRGFYKGYKAVEEQIHYHLAMAQAERKKLYLTGHSLGAALATIAGAELVGKYPVEGFYTYGQPKTGKEQLRELYQSYYQGRFHRFRNDDDIVTRIPPNFCHLGQLFWFDGNGELKQFSPGGLALESSIEEVAEKNELTETEFIEFQKALDAVCDPDDAGDFFLPPTDAQIGGLSLFPGYFSDHSILTQYIPIMRKHAERS